NLFRNVGIERAGSKVIHKEQRGCALHGDVIHAVIHQIAAHRVVQVHHESKFQFCADAIHAGDQHRLAKLLLVDGIHAAEAADLAHHSFGKGAMGQVLDALLGTVGAINVDAAVGISNGGLFQ